MLPEITGVCVIAFCRNDNGAAGSTEQLSGQSCAACGVTVNEISSGSGVFQLAV